MPVSSARTFRVFVSSTFADLAEERNALQREVFPLLRAFCEQHGARFQPVDLRWGVSAEAGQDQRTMSICLDEIRRCQQTTRLPNFIVLLGDRYGWRPLPAEIPEKDFERLQAAISLKENVAVFGRLYSAIDWNAVPPVYCLRPRTAELEADWASMERELLSALDSAAREIGMPLAERVRYGGSATEQEIVCGLLRDDTLPKAREHVHAFLRNVRDLTEDESSESFLDWTGGAPDSESGGRLRELKRQLRAALNGNVHEYNVSRADAVTAAYTVNLCQDVYTALAPMIAKEAGKFETLDPLDREIDAHEAFAAERDRLFIGRAAILQKVADYLENGASQPFALTGRSGSGKSAAMVRALSDARRQFPEAALVFRFIGVTGEASGGVTLLDSLSRQVTRIYGGNPPPLFAEYPRMVAVFRERLKLARAERPLIFFLDALDQLPSSDFARSLSWLPLDQLPPHVRVVVSASSDAPGPAELLTNKLDESQRAYLDPLPADEAGQLLTLWLEDARRTLQAEQRDSLLAAFRSSGLPLYLRFAFEQGKLWRSFESPAPLGADVIQIIRQTFEWLADPARHGDMLVRRSLGYLTAAKDGLTEDEMVEVLSADSAVMTDFRRRFPKSPTADQLPLVIWSRLYYDLKPYLSERGMQGAAVLSFFHRQMRQAAASEYLGPRLGTGTPSGARAVLPAQTQRVRRHDVQRTETVRATLSGEKIGDVGRTRSDALRLVFHRGEVRLRADLRFARRLRRRAADRRLAGRAEDADWVLWTIRACPGTSALRASAPYLPAGAQRARL